MLERWTMNTLPTFVNRLVEEKANTFNLGHPSSLGTDRPFHGDGRARETRETRPPLSPGRCRGPPLRAAEALTDPPCEGIAEALATCRTASIHVGMVSAETRETAEAIARKIGLVLPSSEA